MTFSIVFERIGEPGFPPGYCQACIPPLRLATHGLGVEGTRETAREFVALRIAEERAQGEGTIKPW
jgi:hypothetical protein